MTLKLKATLRKLNRAFHAKDASAWDEAMEEAEEKIEDAEKEEDPIEIHNHIPDSRDTMGELPEKGGSVSSPAFDEEPPWFKEHKEATDKKFKSMMDAMNEGFKKWANEEKEEPEHKGEDESEEEEALDEFPPKKEEKEDEGNLEMEDRRRNNDRHDEANKSILGELEAEAPPGTGDRAMKAKDSAYLEESFQDTLAKAEVLSPGIRLPTFDRKAPPIKTAKAIFALRRTALDLAYNQATTRGIIDQAMSGRTMDSKRMGTGSLRVLFNAVASAVGSSNNSRATDRSTEFSPGGGLRTNTNGARIQSIADMNRVNREKYARK